MEELLQKIIIKAYEVNKNTKHSVFLNFSGHVNLLSVNYHKNGWKASSDPDYRKEVYLNEKYADIELEQILNDIEKLEKVIYPSDQTEIDNF